MIGKTLGHYEITSLLGKGGMGEVYRARDTRLGRDVALKVLPADMAADPERRGRFQREAQAVAALKHPNIVTIHSVEEDGDIVFFTMELIEGQSLSDLIPKNGFSLEKTFELAIPLADALAEAHAQNITHRDLKPANIMFDAAGRLKVLDFGLAKLLGPATADADATVLAAETETREGRILGTAAYMSPEQAEGKPVDHRSDIFSAGILLYEMVTGERPFQGETSMSTLSAILKDTPSSVTDLKPSLPRHLARVIHRCLAKDPERRYQSMKDVRNELEELRQEVRPDPFWKKPAFLGGAAVVLVLAAFGLSRLLPGDTASVPEASASPSSIAIFAFENLKDPEDPERLGQILQELVITDLSGHDGLDILSSQRLFDLHRQIAGGGVSRIDRSKFTEVASQAGATAMLTGTLSQLGDRWIIASQIVDLGSGKVITSERIDGSDLYRMVDDLSGRIYADLAPAETAPAADLAVSEQTTSSLSAYQRYLEGVELLAHREYEEAELKLQEALRLDPNFGQARLRLAIASWWAGETGSGGEVADDLLLPLVDGTLKVSQRDQLLARGMFSILNARYAEGEPLMQRMTELYPDDKDAWYGLGEARYHKVPNDMESAAVAFARALELDPTFLPAFTHLENFYTNQRRYAEAILSYRGLMRGDPDHIFWYTSLLGALIAHGDENEAEQLLRATLTRFRGDENQLEIWTSAARHYDRVENPVRALECWTEALAIDPTSAETMAKLGGTHFGLDQWEEAERWFRRAEEASVDGSGLRAISRPRIIIALSEDRTADALRLAREHAELWPSDFARTLLITCYLRDNQPTEAARIAESALESSGSTRGQQAILSWTAFAYLWGDELEQSVETTRRGMAMENGEEISWLWDDLATPYIHLGQYDDAEAAAKRTLELSPRLLRNGELSMVELDMLRGDPTGAEQRLRSILRDGPVTSEFRAGLALTLAERGRYEEAEAEARWAFARKPNAGSHGLLAWVLIAGDLNVDEGIELAEKAMAMPLAFYVAPGYRARPYLPTREHALGLGYLKKKRYEDAVRLLERAREVQPGRELVVEHLAEAKGSL